MSDRRPRRVLKWTRKNSHGVTELEPRTESHQQPARVASAARAEARVAEGSSWRSGEPELRSEADREPEPAHGLRGGADRKSTRLNSSHANISYAVFCLKKKKAASGWAAPCSP